MSLPQDNNITNYLRGFSSFTGIFVTIIGVLVILGWAFDVSLLKGPGPGYSTIKSNVGLAFILLGISIWLQQKGKFNKNMATISQLLAAAAALLGFLTFAEYLFNINIGIDQMLFKESPGAINTVSPNRMALVASLNLIFAGTSLILLNKINTRNLALYFALIGGVLTSVSLLGYIYNSSELYIIRPNYTPIALYAALTFIPIFLGILTAHPSSGLMKTLTSQRLGGYLLRRLLPTLIFLPILLGWLWLIGDSYGLYNISFGVSIYTILVIIILTTLMWFTANSINSIDGKRKRAQEELIRSNNYNRSLIEANLDFMFIIDPNGIITDVNNSTEAVTGYSRDKLIGTNFSKYF